MRGEQAGGRLKSLFLRRSVGYVIVCLGVLLFSVRLSLDPSLRDPTVLGALSTALMAADLTLEDLFTSVQGPPAPLRRVVVVDVAPHRPNRRFSFPQPRQRYAELLDKLVDMGVSVVAFDLVFRQDTEKPEQDKALLDALRRHSDRAVVARLPHADENGLTWDMLATGVAETLDDPRLGPGFGTTLSLLDVDSVLRRTPMTWDETRFPGGRALPVVALTRALRAPAVVTRDAVRVGDLVTPLSMTGTLELRIPDYRAAGLDVSMDEVLEGVVDRAIFKDAIVVVMPPIDVDVLIVRGQGLEKRRVPGGYVVAATIETLLRGHSVRRAMDEAVWVAALGLSLLMAGLLWARPTPRTLFLACAGLTALWLVVVLSVVIASGIWIDAVVPLLAMTATGVGLLAWDAALLRGVFARFLPQQLVDHALSAGFEREHQKGTVSDATVVFVDLQGYTGISERLSGQALVSLVNELHRAIGGVFEAAGGTIVDYMGDAQMIVFGIPKPVKDHAHAAVRAVRAVPRALEALNRRLEGESGGAAGELRVGVGIASGPVTWGFIGAYGHQEFAALGDTTNTAARLQSMTRLHGVTCLISDSTYQLVRNSVDVRRIENAVIRGKQEQQDIYELILAR